jgi:hypothetical protein
LKCTDKYDIKKEKVKLSLQQAVEPYRVVRVKDPTLSRQLAHRWSYGCQPYAPAAIYSQEIFFCFCFLLEAE